MASQTQHQIPSSPSPPSFWHVPTRSTVYHGNKGDIIAFGRTGRCQRKKGDCETGHIMAYQRFRSEALNMGGISNKEDFFCSEAKVLI